MKQFHAVIWKEEDLFVAKALEIEVASQGHSKKEALANLKEALTLYFEDENIEGISSIDSPKIEPLSISSLHA